MRDRAITYEVEERMIYGEWVETGEEFGSLREAKAYRNRLDPQSFGKLRIVRINRTIIKE